MSKLSLLAIAAIAALAACSAATSTESDTADVVAPPVTAAEVMAPAMIEPVAHSDSVQHASYEAVTCEVRARRTANGLLIQARAFADRDITGEYDLVITKSGSAGSSDISQSGALDLVAGSSALLGENEISVEGGARLRAVLTLRDDSGQLCRHRFNL